MSDPLDLLDGTASFTVLATGLDSDARWYHRAVFEEIFLGNGVDDNLIAQLGRIVAASPHKELRKAGTNEVPATPVISAVAVSAVANAQARWVIDGSGEAARASGVTLTFTANSEQFRGTTGHNIQIRIVYDAYGGGSVSISRTGSGTSGDPYLFTIGTKPSASSNNAVVTAFNAATETFGIVSAATASSSSSEDTQSWGFTALSGGVDESNSVGFSNTTKTVELRYWDPGTNGFGYEGPSSERSAEAVIGSSDFKDIQVAVAGNPSVEGGRFGFIRIYLQFGTGDDAVWNLVRTVANSSGTTVYTLGTDVEIGQAMQLDQNRPFKTRFFTNCASKMWLAGDEDNPAKVYISKLAVEDEIAPEGCNTESWISISGSGEEVGRATINALVSDEQHVHAHTSRGITLITPSDTARYNAPVLAGAFNQNVIAQWEKGRSFYLGRDLLLYEFNGARYGMKDATFKSLDAAAYMRETLDRDAIALNPDRAWMMPDINGQMLWMFLPATDGTLKGFAYDQLFKGIVGPFDFPKIYGSARMEANRSEIVCSDEDGNLFFIDTADQDDHGDSLPVVAAPTAYATDYTAPAEYNGWGSVVYNGAKYIQATDLQIESGMIDLGSATQRKQFLGAVFSIVPNSRGFVEVTLTGESGMTVTRRLGEVGALPAAQQKFKMLMQISDYAVKVKFRVIVAEQKPIIIRDVSLLYAGQGRK